MDVILKEDIEKLGFKDEVVTVKDGYGRNFLIPTGKAVIATPSAKKMMEETVRQRAHKDQKMREEAEKLVESIQAAKVAIPTKAGEQGKIFGSVNNIQLANALKELNFQVERKNIKLMEEPIKQLGNYKAEVRLYKDITATIEFEVVAE